MLGLSLGVAFVYASIDKIRHPSDFARIVYHYQVIGPNATIPPLLPNVFAVTLPWIEALAGLLLVAGLWRREAALLTAVLLVVFLAGVGSILYRGIDVEGCGCFSVGAGGRRAGAQLLVEDAVMLAGALILAGVRPSSSPASSLPGVDKDATAA